MYITIIDGLKKPYRVDLRHFGKNRISFGRNEDCDIILQSEYASRAHGCFYINGDTCVIEDSNSTNGLVYNNQRIKKQKLRDGDEICIKGKASRKELEVRFLFSDTVPQAESHTVEPSVRVVTTERIVEKKVFPLIGKIGMAASVAAVLLLLIFAVILPNKGKKLKGEYFSEDEYGVTATMTFDGDTWVEYFELEDYSMGFAGIYTIEDNRVRIRTITGEEEIFLFDGRSNKLEGQDVFFSSSDRKEKTVVHLDETYIEEFPDKVQRAADTAFEKLGYENIKYEADEYYEINNDDLKHPSTSFEKQFAQELSYTSDETLQGLMENGLVTFVVWIGKYGALVDIYNSAIPGIRYGNKNKSDDVTSAYDIRTAIETALGYEVVWESVVEEHANQVFGFTEEELDVFHPLFKQVVLEALDGEIPQVKYTVNGATKFAFMVTDNERLYIYIASADRLDQWEILPDRADEYQ